MNFNLFIVCLCLLQVEAVKNNCDGFFECLTDVFRDFLGAEVNKTNVFENLTHDNKFDNNVTKINIKPAENYTTINAFDLSSIQKGFNKAIEDITSFITDEINSKLKVTYETSETVNNKTNVHVKAFDLDSISDEVTHRSSDEITQLDEDTGTFTESTTELTLDFSETNEDNVETKTYTSTDFPISELFFNNINTNDTINITGKITPIITDNPLTINHTKYEIGGNDDSITVENVTEIYIEPLHIEIIPDITIPFGGGVQDLVKDLTDKIIKNITDENISRYSDEGKATFKFILNHNEDNNSNDNNSIAYEQYHENIDHNVFFQDLFKDFQPPTVELANTTTIFYNFTIPTNENVTSDNNNIFTENTLENEIPIDLDFDYDANDTQDENVTDYLTIDYVELYKDTTNEDVEYKPTEAIDLNSNNVYNQNDLENVIDYSEIKEVLAHDANNSSDTLSNAEELEPFKWIATIFIKNGTTSQFDYYCDGAVLTERVILTAARCVSQANHPLQPDDVIVITGKRNLQTFGDGEVVHRIKQITLHEDFTPATESSDLAALELEEPVTFGETSQPVAVGECEEGEKEMTTGWAFSGDLATIPFEKEKDSECDGKTNAEKMFCAKYGLDISTCPSYGGLYVVQSNEKWCLKGIRIGDPSYRGLCFERNVRYTDLNEFKDWIMHKVMEVV